MEKIRKTGKILEKCSRISQTKAELMGVWARCRHFSYIIDGSKIVASGTNSRKTHPANLMYSYVGRDMSPISSNVGTHSEMRAVLSLGIENCRGLTLINVRLDRNGRPAQSRPCPGCMDMIVKAGFSELFYTDDTGQFSGLEFFQTSGRPLYTPKWHTA